ncbi:MAG: hypothetical protein ACKOF9_14475, partial [Burkholderiales bacterium]
DSAIFLETDSGLHRSVDLFFHVNTGAIRFHRILDRGSRTTGFNAVVCALTASSFVGHGGVAVTDRLGNA